MCVLTLVCVCFHISVSVCVFGFECLRGVSGLWCVFDMIHILVCVCLLVCVYVFRSVRGCVCWVLHVFAGLVGCGACLI